MDLIFVLEEFNKALEQAEFNVGHNIGFDVNIIGSELLRKDLKSSLHDKKVLDTMTDKTAEVVAIPGGRGGKFKFPNLGELHEKLFAEKFDEDQTLVDAVKTLLRSESVLEDYTTLLVSQPEIIKELIGNSLSALVNVHMMVTVGDEIERRAGAE